MYELDATLAARGKKAEMEILARDQPAAGAMSFTRQQAPLGLGHAVWCARDIVGDEPFAVVLPDELVLNTPGLPQADDRGRGQARRKIQPDRGGRRACASDPSIRHLRRRQALARQDVRSRRHGGKAAARAPRPPTSRSPGATSCSRRSSRSWRPRSAAPAARSSLPMR